MVGLNHPTGVLAVVYSEATVSNVSVSGQGFIGGLVGRRLRYDDLSATPEPA